MTHLYWVALKSIWSKEINRFARIWIQTLVPPVITMTLYFIIFGNLIGSRIGDMHGFSYMQFIVPGLIMMSVITNAYANVASSFFSAKFQRNIEELLVAPVPTHIIIAGYVGGGVARGVCVGILVTAVSLFFVPFHVFSWPMVAITLLLTAVLFSLAGLLNAVFARTFDDISLIPTFVLTPDHLVTVRFHELRAFEAAQKRLAEGERAASSTETFLLIVEELVDGLADALEDMGSELDALSTRIFDFDVSAGKPRNGEAAPRRRDLALRRILRGIGRRGKALGKIRSSLLGLERVVPFVASACEELLKQEEDGRFETIRRDIESLDEFETRLSENVQFLLDAALGLIQIEQNNVFRVLTVVSVVGVPPTLIASMYGMNFKAMPELNWAYGYPYALGLILLSALVPILYFRIRGWF